MADIEVLSPATASHTAGSLLMVGGRLLKAASAIAIGEAITDSNTTSTTAAEVLLGLGQ